MPKSIRPKNADPAAYLRWLFEKTEQDLIDEIFQKRARGHVDYGQVAALERIQNDLQDMVDQSYEYVPKMIEKRFYKTNKDLSGYANAINIAGRTNMVIMETLADNLLGEIVEAAAKAAVTAGTLYTIARLDEDEFRQAALTNTAYAEALGKGAYTTAEMMEASLRNHGITAFVDKAGRQWSLSDYCNMASRTTARQAEVAGVLSADEHDLYQIVKIGTTCPVCAPLEGRVYSKSGTNPNYPPLAMAFGKIDPAGSDDLSNTYLNIHPNCLHSLVKFTEMGKSEKQLQKIREFSSPETNPLTHDPRSKKQIQEYREKERRRAAKLRELRKKEIGEFTKSGNGNILERAEFNSGAASDKFFEKQTEYLTEHKIGKTFNYWSDKGSAPINKVLRGQYSSILPEEYVNATVSAGEMKAYISNQALAQDIRVYRVMDKRFFEAGLKDGVYSDKGFTATSTLFEKVAEGDPKYSEPIWMEITVPAGKGQGAYIKGASEFPEEYEYLIQCGSSFDVIGERIDENGKRIMRLVKR